MKRREVGEGDDEEKKDEEKRREAGEGDDEEKKDEEKRSRGRGIEIVRRIGIGIGMRIGMRRIVNRRAK